MGASDHRSLAPILLVFTSLVCRLLQTLMPSSSRACATSDIIMLTLWLLNKQTVELSNIRQ